MENLNEFREIQTAVDGILNVKSVAKRKRKNDSEKKRELFFQIIHSMEEMNVRQNILFADLSLDFSSYDEMFFKVIDQLLLLHFGKKAANLIDFYLYQRINPDGTMNPVYSENGDELFINDAYQLWDLIQVVIR